MLSDIPCPIPTLTGYLPVAIFLALILAFAVVSLAGAWAVAPVAPVRLEGRELRVRRRSRSARPGCSFPSASTSSR